MKKIIGLVLALVMVMGAMPIGTIKAYAAEGDVAINETNFPDATFREYIKKNFDENNDDRLSQDERNKVEEIIVVKKRIKSLKGIEHFPELWRIKCEENKLSELDVSRNKNLVSLNCGDNKLGSLDISKNTALTALYCSNNQLTELDVSNNPNLDTLKCYMNKLSKLDVQKNPKLTDLYCNFNQLKELDVSKNLALKEFKCNKNQIEKLNVSNNKELTLLDCSNNQLENLNVKENTKLEKFGCSDNKLTELDVSQNTALLHLDCGTNKLKALDVSRCPEIDTLMCYVNELKKLDVSMNKKLEWLSCFNNQLTELDVSKNSELAKFNANNNPLTSVKLGSNDYTEKSLNPFYSIEVPKGVSEIKFPKGFDASKIKGSIQGISINGDSLEWDEKTEKAEFKYKLCDKPEEIVTISVEFDKKDNPDLEAAKELVQKAENNRTEENYKIAKVKVDALLKGSGKNGLEDRLEKVRNFLLDELNKSKTKAKEDIKGLNLKPEEKTAAEKAIEGAGTKADVEKAVEDARTKDAENKAQNNRGNKSSGSYSHRWYYAPSTTSQTKAEDKNTVALEAVLTIGSKRITRIIDGNAQEAVMDVAAYIEQDRTYIPLRFVGEALGFDVSWDAANRIAILKNRDKEVKVSVDSNIFYVNGEKFESDVKPQIKNNRTMIPIGNFARAIGLKDGEGILWNEGKREVRIKQEIHL